jgi:pimeloyl-ACP methyl ester carboxylesterase
VAYLLVDPPGTGASSPAPPRFTMEACAEAAVEILDAAATARAVFLGVSWRGFVALRVALNAPHRCTALVLSNTSADRLGPIQRQRDKALAALIGLGVPRSWDVWSFPRCSARRHAAATEDHALPPAHSQRLAREIPGATLHAIPDIAHLAPRESSYLLK